MLPFRPVVMGWYFSGGKVPGARLAVVAKQGHSAKNAAGVSILPTFLDVLWLAHGCLLFLHGVCDITNALVQ